MADFLAAIDTVLSNEGGLVDDPLDYGGITNFGISLHFYQTITPSATKQDIKDMTREMAIAIYRKSFWDPNKYSMIASQAIATKTFDFAVNMGAKNANLCLQRAVIAAKNRAIIQDGILGTQSLYAINYSPPDCVMAALKSEAAGFYRCLAEKIPSNKKFLNGWLTRAYSDV